MAGFEIVEGGSRPIWMPVDYGSGGAATVYEGQLVVAGAVATCQGVKGWTPAGNADTTADQVPFGVVLGLNNKTPLYNSTYGAYGTSVGTQATLLARDWRLAEGMWAKGDPALMALVAPITPATILKGRIFDSTWGTAPTLQTVTTGSTDGLGFTGTTAGFTPVAYNATYYCRTGANKGLYRVSYDTSATVHTFYLPFPYDIAIGDTFVAANIGLGTVKMCLGGGGCFIDNNAAVGSDYLWADVLELNLETAGSEYAIFRINPLNLLAVRA